MCRWIALIAAIIVVIALLCSVFSSRNISQSDCNQIVKDKIECSTKEFKPSWRTILLDPNTTFNLFLALFTLVLAGVSIWQLILLNAAQSISLRSANAAKEAADAAKDSVLYARETTEKQLRAYLFINASQIERLSTSEKIVAIFQVKNFGQTPAKNFLAEAKLYIDENEQGSFTTIGSIPGGIVAPSNYMVLTLIASDLLTADQFNDIIKGTKSIIIRGKVSYIDAFGKERWTEFGQFFKGNGKIPSVKDIIPLSNTNSDHNYY